jgi:carotenoid cleavage dioxygenase
MMNTVTDGARLHLDLCLYDGNCFPFFPMPDGTETKPVPPILTRLTFDLAGNTDSYAKTPLCPAPCEMPRTDERYQGRPYRFGYVICRSPSAVAGDMGLGAIGRIDHEISELVTWSPGPDCGVQEPIFVERRRGASEGDGYLLVLVNRMAENRSDLAILDAARIEAGPVALIKLPVRVRSTFHGMWVPARALQTGLYTH